MLTLTRKLLSGCVVLLVLTGCASSSTETETGPRVVTRLPTDAEVEQHNALVDPANRIVCRKEAEVGSNIPKRKCWVVRDLREISTFHREQLGNILR